MLQNYIFEVFFSSVLITLVFVRCFLSTFFQLSFSCFFVGVVKKLGQKSENMKRTQLHCACFFSSCKTQKPSSVYKEILTYFQLVSPPHLKEKQSKAKQRRLFTFFSGRALFFVRLVWTRSVLLFCCFTYLKSALT